MHLYLRISLQVIILSGTNLYTYSKPNNTFSFTLYVYFLLYNCFMFY